MDIHKGLGNANKMMNRLLYMGVSKHKLLISKLNGGSLRNAIPRESTAEVCLNQSEIENFKANLMKLINEIKFEYLKTEPNLIIEFKESAKVAMVADSTFQNQIVKAIYAAHNGVYKMSADMENLVETSNNIAKIQIEKGKCLIGCLTRSSVESSKMDLAQALKSTFELAGCKVSFGGSYPGWTPNINSPILKVLVDIYEKQNGEKPNVVACHAGLECGILGTNYPGMDMISFGPTIKGAHSPDERVSISSVQKYWKFLMEILKNIPYKI
jgi:dipeptidase D